MKKRNLTLGVVAPSLHEACQSMMWDGICHEAEKQGITVLSFVVTSQDRVDTIKEHYHIIADFVHRSGLDGLLMFSGAIQESSGIDKAAAFLPDKLSIPVVSLNYNLEGAYSIEPNNTSGVVELVDHLVNYHNYRKILFVKGPEGHLEAEERFKAYKAGIARNGVAYDSRMVIDGGFQMDSGRAAMRQIFAAGTYFDAVMCANDDAAIGVVEEIKKRRKHIPTDVAVTGFDDVEQAQIMLPSLTTVRQPLFEMGRLAVTTALRLIEGDTTVDQRQILDTYAVYRRSCGCFPSKVKNSKLSLDSGDGHSAKADVFAEIARQAENIIGRPLRVNDSADILAMATVDVVEAFTANIKNSATDDLFLNKLDTIIFRVGDMDSGLDLVLQILFELAGYLSRESYSPEERIVGNGLLQTGGALVREYKLKSAQSRNMEESAFELKIRETSQKIITTFDVERLKQTILDDFPRIQIRMFAYVLYESPRGLTNENWKFSEMSKLVLGYNTGENGELQRVEKTVFSTANIIPDRLMSHDKRASSLVVMPLFFQEQQFGYVVFGAEKGQHHFLYEEMRLHIGSSIKSAFMMQELRLQSMVDELTGLYNRRGFYTLSQKMIDMAHKVGGRLVVFFADLDGLKKINDTYGHDEGDRAISATSDVLRATFRTKDILARMGGDEFAVILHVGDATMPEEGILDRIDERIAEFNVSGQADFSLSISIGTASFDAEESWTIDEILKKADARMYAKKRNK